MKFTISEYEAIKTAVEMHLKYCENELKETQYKPLRESYEHMIKKDILIIEKIETTKV